MICVSEGHSDTGGLPVVTVVATEAGLEALLWQYDFGHNVVFETLQAYIKQVAKIMRYWTTVSRKWFQHRSIRFDVFPHHLWIDF